MRNADEEPVLSVREAKPYHRVDEERVEDVRLRKVEAKHCGDENRRAVRSRNSFNGAQIVTVGSSSTCDADTTAAGAAGRMSCAERSLAPSLSEAMCIGFLALANIDM
jgi:hypothetical protein